MNVIFDDGGRSQYFKAGHVSDCVTRAFAIATQTDYKLMYDAIRRVTGEKPRNGITKKGTRKIAAALGLEWVSTMGIGTGCKVHLTAGELPSGRIVCACSGHLVAVIDGEVHDTYDSTRGGTRCVYGYWIVK